jgi:DNA polymerase-1
MSNKLAILVDGSGFIYRAYYALPQMTDKNGEPIGAVYGFCSILISLLNKHHSDLFCVVFDSGRDTFRSKIYPEYKGNRGETPENLKKQFPLLRKACAAFGIPSVEQSGFEADDVIATYANKLSTSGHEVQIVSSDKDLMQLIDDKISLLDPIKSKFIRTAEVMEKYGVLPSQMIMLQALTGDASDNIPGVSGIGPKTAAKLINEFKTLENIYANINEIKQQKIKEKLVNERDTLYLSLKLVTLEKNVPIDDNVILKITYDHSSAASFLGAHDFTSLVARLRKRL